MVLQLLTAKRFLVQDHSMQPFLQHGDKILLHKPPKEFAPGMVIVFHHSKLKKDFIKRVHAIGPLIVKITEGYKKGNWKLKENELFLLGDNLEDSLDSRDFGPIHVKNVIGVYWKKY